MSTLAVELALRSEILPRWNARNGGADVLWSPTGVLVERIDAGARADVLIAIDEPMNKMIGKGILAAGSMRPIAQAGFGIAGRTGQPLPDISSLEKFKAVLLGAKSIVYSRTGASGIHFLKVIDDLGIGVRIRPKTMEIPSGFTAEKVASGEAEIAVQQISELMTVEGVEVIGPFPEPVQKRTDFSAAIFSEASDPKLAERFIDLLGDAVSADAYSRCGLSPRRELA